MEYAAQFERDFMSRTLTLVRQYSGPYDATLLLNCLLGLLIVPKETSIDKIPTDPISELKKWGIEPSSIMKFGRTTDTNRYPKTLRGIVWNLRNAVAHFRFKPIHKEGKCIGFTFDDASGFKARIMNDQMRDFVEKLAAHLERKLSS
jgi:hypothetical protein